MKKIIILLLLCVTGCSAEYNLSIDEKTISETTVFIENNSANFDKLAYYDMYYDQNLTYREAIDRFTKNPPAINIRELDLIHTDVDVDYEVYNVKTKNKEQLIELTYQHDFNYDNFANSTLANSCYQHFAFLNSDGKYYLSTSDAVNCFQQYPLLEDIKIKISSYYQVDSHNADQYDSERNEYTWLINRNDAKDKPIQMVIDTSKKANIKRNLWDYFKENPVVIGLLLIVAISGVISIPIMVIKNKKNNEM